ncbi:MAG: 50S ribosomal protein L25 [Parcubacteria group bacterium]|jgi:large subunit ribosomal protein L25
MKKVNLKSKTREEVGNGKKLDSFRKNGMIPAVMYGHKIKAQNIWVKYLEFEKAYNEAGESTVIELEIGDKKVNALVHDIQVDPMTGKFSHIDFFQVRMDEKIETNIPLEFIGESPAIKELGGMLVKSLDEIKISCLPADLPSEITVDISKIKTFDDHIKIKDLDISDNVKVLDDEEMTVALVEAPRSEEELASLEEKVEEDVTKVEGVVKETPAEEGEDKKEDKKEKK